SISAIGYRGGSPGIGWRIVGPERPDPLMQQQITLDSNCGQSVAQSLLLRLGIEVSQRQMPGGGVAGYAGKTSPEGLADILNSSDPQGGWNGGYVLATRGALGQLSQSGSWAAMVKTPSSPLHWVLVRGIDADGNVM